MEEDQTIATAADESWDDDEDAPSFKNFVTRALWPAVKELLTVSLFSRLCRHVRPKLRTKLWRAGLLTEGTASALHGMHGGKTSRVGAIKAPAAASMA